MYAVKYKVVRHSVSRYGRTTAKYFDDFQSARNYIGKRTLQDSVRNVLYDLVMCQTDFKVADTYTHYYQNDLWVGQKAVENQSVSEFYSF